MFRFLMGGSPFHKTPMASGFFGLGRRLFHETPTNVLSKRDRLNKVKLLSLLKLLELPRKPNAKEIKELLNTKNSAARSPLVKQLISITQDAVAKKFNATTDPEVAAFGKTMNDEHVTKGEENQKITDDVLNYLAKLGIARNEAAEQQQAITEIAKPFARSANRGALPGEQQQAIEKITDHRLAKKLPALDLTKKVGGETGTVAYIKVGGQEIFGYNTKLERGHHKVDTLPLRKGVLSEIQKKLKKLVGATIDKAGRFLTHAETQALINAKQKLGKLPKKLTLYVDRPTCNMCSGSANNGLPVLAEHFGVEELTIIDSLGTMLLVRPGQNTIRIK